jgi:hypothetical protein
MSLISAPARTVVFSIRTARAGMRLATFPARAAATLVCGTYEEMLDVAERAELVEPPDPPAKHAARGRRPAA